MKKTVVLLLFLVKGAVLFAQTGGLKVADDRYERVPLLPTYSGIKYTEIPARISLKRFCPVPGNQGESGTCVGWAIGYSALTIQRAIALNLVDKARITQTAHSAAFLYNQVRKSKADCTEGAYLEDGLELVKLRGDCLEQSFNFEKNNCNAQPDAAQLAEAMQYRVQDYAALFALDEDAKSKVGKACKVLATQTPVIVGMGVTKSFFEVLPGADSWNPEPNEPLTGYHAMVLVGYNSVEKYFELLNSFGTSWGQNGFIRVSFDDFERLCRYAYVMVPPSSVMPVALDESQPVKALPVGDRELSGEFVFRQPAGYLSNENGDELLYFEEVTTQQLPMDNIGLYKTQRPEFNVGDVFQLVARNIPRGRYVYVFSKSPDGVLNRHFPRKHHTVTSAGFVLEKTAEIVIPGEESMLQIPATGVDYLCILYSCAPISNYEQRLERIEKSSEAFPETIQQVFADVLIPPSQTQFSREKMAFSAISTAETGQIAVLMTLGVTAR